jgi:hypothetical protein
LSKYPKKKINKDWKFNEKLRLQIVYTETPLKAKPIKAGRHLEKTYKETK